MDNKPTTIRFTPSDRVLIAVLRAHFKGARLATLIRLGLLALAEKHGLIESVLDKESR